jgi:CubicO group peptidase (beta-lactamase class C family)
MSKIQHIIVALLLAAPLSSQSFADQLDRYLRSYAEAGYFSGTVLVARGDSILYERSFGYANRELAVPLTPTTRVNVASITKPLTVILLSRLVDQGLLRPDHTLARYLPGFPRASDITISHVINHRAGIPHRVTTPEQETVPRSAQDMVDLAAQATLMFEPGDRSVYSSAGYSVLARVLELAGGADYQTLMEREVFAPSGATRTVHPTGAMVLEGRASSYTWGTTGHVNAPLQDLSFLVGAGSIYTTPGDLFRIMRWLLAGRYGETAQTALLRQAGVSWNGSTGGFRAWLDWVRASDITMILSANLQSGVNDMIRRDLPRLLAGEVVVPEPPPVIAPVPVRREVLARYDGDYAREGASPLPFRAGDGGMRVGNWWIVATSDSTFFSRNDFGVVTARTGADGVMEFTWNGPGFTSLWRRVPTGQSSPPE